MTSKAWEHVTLSERKIKSPKHVLPLRPVYGLLIFSGKGRHAPVKPPYKYGYPKGLQTLLEVQGIVLQPVYRLDQIERNLKIFKKYFPNVRIQ